MSNLYHAPLMMRLARLRTRAHTTQTAVAAALGVDRATISRWEAGQRSPHYADAATYARLLDQHIVLRDGRHVIAADCDIPDALPRLRATAGLTARQYARRLRIIPPAVHAAERRRYQLLSSVEAAAAGLDLTLDLHTARAARSGVAA